MILSSYTSHKFVITPLSLCVLGSVKAIYATHVMQFSVNKLLRVLPPWQPRGALTKSPKGPAKAASPADKSFHGLDKRAAADVILSHCAIQVRV